MRQDPSASVIPADFWERRAVRDALTARDVGALFTLVRRYAEASQTGLMMRTGIAKSEVSLIRSAPGHRFGSFQAIADGLAMPNSARLRLGLALG